MRDEKLKLEDALKLILPTLEVALAKHMAIAEEYLKEVSKTFAGNLNQVPDFGAKGIPGFSSDRILAIPTHFDVASMKSRVVGVATAADVGTAMVAKTVNKRIIKAAAKALSKVVVSKVAGTAGGAAVGAVASSMASAAVTAIGGIIGGGLAGVAVDKMMIKLDEAFSREEFKKEIAGSVREPRDKLKNELFGAH